MDFWWRVSSWIAAFLMFDPQEEEWGVKRGRGGVLWPVKVLIPSWAPYPLGSSTADYLPKFLSWNNWTSRVMQTHSIVRELLLSPTWVDNKKKHICVQVFITMRREWDEWSALKFAQITPEQFSWACQLAKWFCSASVVLFDLGAHHSCLWLYGGLLDWMILAGCLL